MCVVCCSVTESHNWLFPIFHFPWACLYCEYTQCSGAVVFVLLLWKPRRGADSSLPSKTFSGGFHRLWCGKHLWGVFQSFYNQTKTESSFFCELVHCNKPLPCPFLSQTTLELKNMTSSSRHIRVIPPTTPYFSIGLGELLLVLIGWCIFSCCWCGEEISKCVKV